MVIDRGYRQLDRVLRDFEKSRKMKLKDRRVRPKKVGKNEIQSRWGEIGGRATFSG